MTAYPAMHLLAGACASYCILVDISNPEKPVRLDARADTNFSLWHTAVFSNDGKKIVFTDEWGGGTGPMCQATSMMEMGGNTTLTISKEEVHAALVLQASLGADGAGELRVAQRRPRSGAGARHHGAGLVSGRRGRDRLHRSRPSVRDRVLRSRTGRCSRRPRATRRTRGSAAGAGTIGGSWGAYYWNGLIYSSELARGFDIYELQPTDKLSANELAAAKLVKFVEYNPQSQPKIVWPAAFPVVRSYLDQLVRNDGLSSDRTAAIGKALDAAEKQNGAAQRSVADQARGAGRQGCANGAARIRRVRRWREAIRDLAAGVEVAPGPTRTKNGGRPRPPFSRPPGPSIFALQPNGYGMLQAGSIGRGAVRWISVPMVLGAAALIVACGSKDKAASGGEQGGSGASSAQSTSAKVTDIRIGKKMDASQQLRRANRHLFATRCDLRRGSHDRRRAGHRDDGALDVPRRQSRATIKTSPSLRRPTRGTHSKP